MPSKRYAIANYAHIISHMRVLSLGFIVTLGIGAAAFALRFLPSLAAVSPAILAALIGIILSHLIKLPSRIEPGVQFSSRTLLRLGVALLGLQITFSHISMVGWRGFLVVTAGLSVSFVVIKLLGRLLQVEPRLAELIAAGTSVCGASAIAGVNTITQADEEDVAYAIAIITIFGTLSMLIFPLLKPLLNLEPAHYGLWAGAAIHEVAQVVGTTVQIGPEAAQYGTIAKLTRVMLLVPLILVLQWRLLQTTQTRSCEQLAVPFFVWGFIALMVVGSLINIPEQFKTLSAQLSGFLLAMALGGMGLKVNILKLRTKGISPLVLGALSSIFISVFTLGLIEILI